MKKQIKKTNNRQTKRLQLDKTAISSFDAKQVKGGAGRTETADCVLMTQRYCVLYTGNRECV